MLELTFKRGVLEVRGWWSIELFIDDNLIELRFSNIGIFFCFGEFSKEFTLEVFFELRKLYPVLSKLENFFANFFIGLFFFSVSIVPSFITLAYAVVYASYGSFDPISAIFF